MESGVFCGMATTRTVYERVCFSGLSETALGFARSVSTGLRAWVNFKSEVNASLIVFC
jgi:hypothetical protein